VRLFSGLTAMFYDHAGVLQQARIRVTRGISLEGSGRVGESGGIFEGSISAGVVWHIR